MARTPLLLLLLTFVAHIFSTAAAEPSDNCHLNLPFQEKQIKLHFFWHNRFGKPNTTAVSVASSPSTNDSPTGFGIVNVFDDPLTVDSNESSRLLGYSQGTYLSADRRTAAALMVMSFVFVDEQDGLKGSTFSVLGRNELNLKVRELPIVGGTGVLRFARGYCALSTYAEDSATNYAVVEYNCDVFYKHVLSSEL